MKKQILLPKQVIADYSYNVPIANGKDTVRFVFAPVENHEKPFVLLVIAQAIISPMNYPVETFKLIIEFLKPYSINIKDVDIYLDFIERYGEVHGTLSKWEFSLNQNRINDSFTHTLTNELPLAVKFVREQYYKWV